MTAGPAERRQRVFQTWGGKIASSTWHKPGRVYARKRQDVCLSLQNFCIRMSKHLSWPSSAASFAICLPIIRWNESLLGSLLLLALWAPSSKAPVTQQDSSCLFPPALFSRTDTIWTFPSCSSLSRYLLAANPSHPPPPALWRITSVFILKLSSFCPISSPWGLLQLHFEFSLSTFPFWINNVIFVLFNMKQRTFLFAHVILCFPLVTRPAEQQIQ